MRKESIENIGAALHNLAQHYSFMNRFNDSRLLL